MRKCLMFIVLFAILSSLAIAMEFPAEGIINSKDVRVRKKASTGSAAIASLELGTRVTVLEEYVTSKEQLWYIVETPKGKTGYVLADYISVADTEKIEAAENSPSRVKMKVKIVARCSDYNNVGKNWTQFFEINGIPIKDNQYEMYVAPGVDIQVYARIREQDKKPDTGTELSIYTPTQENVINGFTIQQSIQITENSGKHKGNSANWTVQYVFEPEDTIADTSAAMTVVSEGNE